MAYLKGPLAWLVVAVVACGAVALTYLPPRGRSRDARSPLSGVVTGAPTAERLRANELAKQWRRAALAVRLSDWRAALAPELNRRRAAEQPTLAIAVDSSWSPVVRERITRVLEGTWRALGLGTTKIGVAVVVEPDLTAGGLPFRPAATSYLLPDSLDRHTCVARASPSRSYQRLFSDSSERSARELEGWTRTVVGPCVFYASFGKPSLVVERWLAPRAHRFAQHAAWDSLRLNTPRMWFTDPAAVRDPEAVRQWLYQTFPAVVLGCMSGKVTACRSAALGPGRGESPSSLVARMSDPEGDLPAATVFLSEMVREFGRARFARFWTSDLPVDSAFHVAMDTTLGDWVLSRQRAYGVRLHAGPAAPLGASVIGLAWGVLGLVLAIVAARRRQVG